MGRRKTAYVEPLGTESGDPEKGIEGLDRGSQPIPAEHAVFKEETPDSMIARHNALKAHLAAQTKAFSDYCKPFKDEQDAIEAWLHDFLLKTKQNSAKTDHGTCYLSTLTQPKIVDRTAFLDYCLEHWSEDGDALLQIGAPQVGAFEAFIDRRKKELDAHQANTGQLLENASITPPGTNVSYFQRLNIRKI